MILSSATSSAARSTDPIRIPGLYNGKDKSFFSFGAQATRIRTAASDHDSRHPAYSCPTGRNVHGLSGPIFNPKTLVAYPCTPVTAGTPPKTTYNCTVAPSGLQQVLSWRC